MVRDSLMVRLCDATVVLNDRTLIRDVDLELSDNQVTTVIGPNGAGKTTLIKAVVGLQTLTRGTRAITHPIQIGYMPQAINLNPSLPLTVESFLAASRFANSDNTQAVIDQVGAAHLLHRSMHDLSGGEKQRVLLARALIGRPNLLVLDEPAQGVDISGQAQFYQLIKQIQTTQKMSILMVSHDLHLVMACTDQVVCINQHICCYGHPNSIQENPSYLKLFGLSEQSPFAVYQHHHDHTHDLDGHITDQNNEPRSKPEPNG